MKNVTIKIDIINSWSFLREMVEKVYKEMNLSQEQILVVISYAIVGNVEIYDLYNGWIKLDTFILPEKIMATLIEELPFCSTINDPYIHGASAEVYIKTIDGLKHLGSIKTRKDVENITKQLPSM